MRVLIEIPPLSSDRTTRACVVLMQAAADVEAIADEELGPAANIHVARPRFQPENFDDGCEHFDLPRVVVARGWGDCDDLTIARYRECQRRGEAPPPRTGILIPGQAIPAVVWRGETRRFHARLRRADGSLEDPSMIRLGKVPR